MKEIKNFIYNLKKMFFYLINLVPQLFILIILIAVFDAILPYVNIIAMQLMIDGFIDKKAIKIMVIIIFITIGLNVIFKLVLGELRRRREVLDIRLDLEFKKKLSVHEMGLSIKDIESTKVKELKRNIEQSNMRSGGVEHIVYDFEIVVKNIISLIISGIVFLHIFSSQKSDNKISFWTSIYPVIILIFIVMIFTLITFHIQSKHNIFVSDLNDKVNQANGSAFAYMEFISNYHFGKDIRIYELGDYLCNFFENLWTSSIGYTLMQKLGKEKAKIPCITVICNEILNIFIYVLAIWKAYAKELSVGNVVVYINSIQAFIQSMVSLIGLSGEIIGHGVLMKPFLELFDIEDELSISSDGKNLSFINEISFEHVYFKYPEQEEWTLEDVSFNIKSNQKIALVGENGAGKSTIIKLICRFYEPDKGHIKINCVDICEYNKKQYWNMISAVFQDFSLPALSLGNVISGKDDYNEEKEKVIFHKIGMDEWMLKLNINFDKYIYNDISDDGIKLSGGESQKIAVARSIYKEAPLIILDEPTAALDPVSEASIFNDLREIYKDKTCIFISHRLYSCRICDFVLVLCKGRLIQQGTHEELMKRNGKYKELWDSQAGLYNEIS